MVGRLVGHDRSFRGRLEAKIEASFPPARYLQEARGVGEAYGVFGRS